jgi:putative MATE family efflux protein
MRAVGDVKTPMFCTIIAVIANCLLNYLLIFGNFGFPKLGVTGAGLATLISRSLELSLLFFCLLRNDYIFKTKAFDLFKIERRLAKSIIIKGLPLVTNEILWAAGLTTLFKFYATRGSEVMVGFGIASTVSDLFYVLFSGMSVATMIIISQNLGANKLKQVKIDAYRLIGFSVFLAVLCGLMMFATSFFVPNWYDVTVEAKSLATTLLRVTSFMMWIYMLSAQCYFILRSGGDTMAAFMLDSCYMWLVNITVVGFLTYFTDFSIIKLYLFGQSTDILKMLIAFCLVKRGQWIRNLTRGKEIVHEC